MWGDSIRKRNVSPRLFSLECCLHCFTDNQTDACWLFYSSFSRHSPSKPLRSKLESCSRIHVQSGHHDHSGVHREATALLLQECMNGVDRSRLGFSQALLLWGSSSVWICVLLWWIIQKKTQWMLSCSEDETLIWWKENCSTVKSCLAARRQFTGIIPDTDGTVYSGSTTVNLLLSLNLNSCPMKTDLLQCHDNLCLPVPN